MTPETQAQIRNIQKFGRYARPFCVLTAATLAIIAAWSFWNILSGPTGSGFRVGLGAYDVTGDQITTPQVKVWSLIVTTAVYAIVLAAIFHLYRLFAHLAAGAIYTRENVHHIRQVGLLAMATAVLQLIVPPLSFMLLEVGFVDAALVSGSEGRLLFGPPSLSGFITASLVLLASWIMDVGRQTSDEAETMRREADLVI